ncbi:tRNA glutamyl-Q(34) synthetase GluQRS [Eionea flava]
MSPYVGRFAPSPSGPLHFGSLVTALASYLDAKHHHGQWLVRIEDIDTPRTVEGAKEDILSCLVAHGLHWDGELMIQSQRQTSYSEHLKKVSTYTYPCYCNRQRLKQIQGIYDGHCRTLAKRENTEKCKYQQTQNNSIRLKTDQLASSEQCESEQFTDLFQGHQQQPIATESGDFILRRKDGLIAYQLAVVVDDIAQGITHVVRGSDLLSSTSRQRYLWLLLNHCRHQGEATQSTLPTYGHIPIAVISDGRKLSKQNQATALNSQYAFNNLCQALLFLGHPPIESIKKQGAIDALLQWATTQWQRSLIPSVPTITVSG